ncbi:MAG: hypothetical protein J6Z12_01745 [Paludibacteraceae bacterium]|nr:hypothetical protein [Paludibacteraceae bacterium]
MTKSVLFRLSAAAVLLPLLGSLGSCINRDYDISDIDTTIGLNTKLIAPVVHTHVTLGEALPETWGKFTFEFVGNDVYMVQNDTVNIGQDLVADMDMFPSSDYTEDLSIIIPAHVGKEADIDQVSVITFDDVNTASNERLDSILCKSGTMRVTFSSTLTDLIEPSHVWIEFPDGGIELNRELYPEGRAWFSLAGLQDAVLDLNGAVLHLNGTNTVNVHFQGKCFSNTDMTEGSIINIKIYFEDIPGRVYYGNVGTGRDLYGASRTVSFSYTNDMEGKTYFLPFYNPEITVEAVNNIGVPVKYYVDEMKAYRKGQTDTVWALFNGSKATDFVLNTPAYSEIAGTPRASLISMNSETLNKETSLAFNRDNGGTQQLFMINPDRLEYHYRVRSIDDNPANVHYFFNDADIELGVHMRFALAFEGHPEMGKEKNFFISQRDTTDFSGDAIDLGDITVTDTTYAILKMEYVNFLPVTATAQAVFTDEHYQPIVTVAPFEIQGAPLGEDGYVKAPTDTTTIWRRLTYKELDRLMREGAYTLYEYNMANEDKKTFRCHKLDWLEGKISIYLEGGVVINQNKEEE